MASNYGLHFGVRRWDEDVAIREGRYKTPTTGSKLLTGSCVEIDFAAPGYMKQGVNNCSSRVGVSGLLIWEDQFLQLGPIGSINAPLRQDTALLAYAALGKYAVIAHGPGSKFWFRNVPERVLPDNYDFPAVVPVAGLGPDHGSSVALGDFLGWNGTQWATVATADEGAHPTAWMQVVTLNDAAASLEATLL